MRSFPQYRWENRSNLLWHAASSEGLLTGELRGRSFTSAYTDRALSSHPDKPTVPFIAFMMIVHNHTLFCRICQFPFPGNFSVFYCLTMSTKCLPKKAGKRWETGLSRFSIFWVSTRCLPRALFLWKSALFYLLLAGFPHLFCCARGVILRWADYWAKTPLF